MNPATQTRPLSSSFDDMEDDLFDDRPLPRVDLGPDPEPTIAKVFHSRCRKCGGTGRWGFTLKPCFGCKGKGSIETKTDPAVLARNRVTAQARKERDRAEWKEAHPAYWSWIERNRESFDFARSLGEWLEKHGSLTMGQEAAIMRSIEREAERDRARAAAMARRAEAAPVVDGSALEECFARARARGLSSPKLAFAEFRFSSPKAHSRNAGGLYVKDRRGGAYLGKVLNGRLYLEPEARHLEDEIKAVMKDPETAAIAYGKKWGKCAICSQDLTDPESVARGIGPVCASRFF